MPGNPLGKPGTLPFDPSFAYPESWLFCHCVYRMMLCSFNPTVDKQYTGNSPTPSFYYILSNHANFFLGILALPLLIRPTTSLTEYSGGMIIKAYRGLYACSSIRSSPLASSSISWDEVALNNQLTKESGLYDGI